MQKRKMACYVCSCLFYGDADNLVIIYQIKYEVCAEHMVKVADLFDMLRDITNITKEEK